ncbi:MAG: PHP domain-containing protein [Candidatus Riflebacteria bacterium]|nr:PHP domain-containing protein [Candidatus Riflebacteria bacterium]
MFFLTTDLHIHTKLSPCASEEMTPRAITKKAQEMGLDIIAICDHNSSRNSAAVIEAAKHCSILVIPGIEIETRDKIHVIGLFSDVKSALKVTEEIRIKLPCVDEKYSSHFGEQILMTADGIPCGKEDKALANSSHFDLKEVVRLIKQHDGLAIAAHVERPSFSVYSQLGDVPLDIPFDALEVSPVGNRPIGLREKFARYGFPLIGSSDSHYLSEIGRAKTRFLIEKPSFEEINLALHRVGGRGVSLA